MCVCVCVFDSDDYLINLISHCRSCIRIYNPLYYLNEHVVAYQYNFIWRQKVKQSQSIQLQPQHNYSKLSSNLHKTTHHKYKKNGCLCHQQQLLTLARQRITLPIFIVALWYLQPFLRKSLKLDCFLLYIFVVVFFFILIFVLFVSETDILFLSLTCNKL